MEVKEIEAINAKLINYIEKEEYQGYDPYDTLNSPLPFGLIGKWGKPIAIQIQKRNPLNLRPLIGIKKGYNPKAMGLFLQAYSLRYQRTKEAELLPKMDGLYNWLIEQSTKGYSGYCWGYNFDWASSVKFLPAYSPTIVVSCFVAKGIRAYYTATKKQEALEVLKSIATFIDQDLEKTEDEDGTCISYSTIEPDCCYNASMLGAELFAFLYAQTNEQRYQELALKASRFVVAKQKRDGRWNYSINLETGKERTQVDFHQGYVLDSLAYVMHCIPEAKREFEPAWQKGTDFYAKNQFVSGRALYRYPSVWPVDIHNQAQGIISFSRWKRNAEDLKLADSIVEYSSKEMRSSKGYFYYKKYPWVTIKTPFIRWAQGWMWLALEEYLKASHE
ncbi:MAG: glycoside hydrolase family 127 protein [Vicingaceae bacterium]